MVEGETGYRGEGVGHALAMGAGVRWIDRPGIGMGAEHRGDGVAGLGIEVGIEMPHALEGLADGEAPSGDELGRVG